MSIVVDRAAATAGLELLRGRRPVRAGLRALALLALLGLPLAADATPLSALVGTTDSIGGLTFTFTNVEEIGGIDLSQIDLVLVADAKGAGFDLVPAPGALAVSNGALADVKIEFTVSSAAGVTAVANYLSASASVLGSSASVSELIDEAPGVDVGVAVTPAGSLPESVQPLGTVLHELTITKNMVVASVPQGSAEIIRLEQRFSVVPEPAGAALLSIGLGGLAAFARRRGRRRAACGGSMRTSRFLTPLVLAAALLLGAAPAARALTLADLVGGGSFSSLDGSLTYSNFSVSLPDVVDGSPNVLVGFDLTLFEVDPTLDTLGVNGLEFDAPIVAAGGGVGVIVVSFDVAAAPGLQIDGVDMNFTGTALGSGALASISEQVLADGALHELEVIREAGGAQVGSAEIAFGTPARQLRVEKRIVVDTRGQGAIVAQISEFEQRYLTSPVPEPGAAAIFVSALLLVGRATRRRA